MLAEPPSKESDRTDLDKIIEGLHLVQEATTHLLDGHHKDIQIHVMATLAQIQAETTNVGRYLMERFPRDL